MEKMYSTAEVKELLSNHHTWTAKLVKSYKSTHEAVLDSHGKTEFWRGFLCCAAVFCVGAAILTFLAVIV